MTDDSGEVQNLPRTIPMDRPITSEEAERLLVLSNAPAGHSPLFDRRSGICARSWRKSEGCDSIGQRSVWIGVDRSTEVFPQDGEVNETHAMFSIRRRGHWRRISGCRLAPPPAEANEIAELKAQIEALQERLAGIEAAQKEAGKKAVTAGETGGWRMPGNDTSISFSGYVKGDFYLDSRPSSDGWFGAKDIPLDGAPDAGDDDGNVGMHARQSRLRFDTHTPTGMGALNTRIETDFYGADSVLRLRQAYGSLGPVLAGQTWSIIGDDHTYADTVDFDGPIGVIATTRKTQLRLTLPMGEGFYGQMAVEPAVEGNELPTFLGALRYSAGWGAVNLTGAVGRADKEGRNVSAHALHAGAHLNVTDATRVMATLNVARGGLNGRILGGAAGAVMVDGKLKARETMGGFAGVSHRWSDSVRSGAYFGWVENDTGDGVSAADMAGTNKAVQSLHANVIWSPVPRANIGFEVMHGWREVYTASPSEPNSGEATRAQIGVQYGF